jgi:hypothetical protein
MRRNMSDGSLRNPGEQALPGKTRALFDIVDERECTGEYAPGLVGPVAPPRLEGDARQVMDGLLREYLKRKPSMP